MRPPIKYALGHEGVSETDTKRVYCNSIVTVTSNLVKKKTRRIHHSQKTKRVYCNSIVTVTSNLVKKKTRRIHHSQKICDPDGVVLKIVLEDATVSITDSKKRKVEFSAYLVPELRSTLLDVEKEFGRGSSHAKI